MGHITITESDIKKAIEENSEILHKVKLSDLGEAAPGAVAKLLMTNIDFIPDFAGELLRTMIARKAEEDEESTPLSAKQDLSIEAQFAAIQKEIDAETPSKIDQLVNQAKDMGVCLTESDERNIRRFAKADYNKTQNDTFKAWEILRQKSV